jgi:hypothetical protein
MLPFDQWLLIGIIIVSTTFYITNWAPTEVTAAGTIVVLMATGLLSAGDALSGFASTATITVAAMFILSAGLMRTGALEAVTIYLGRFANGSARRLLLLLALVEVPASAFMNNTPVVVMMIPVVVSLCRQYNLRPSKFLLPVSYFAVLGGTITLIGTSTNILVSDLYRQAGGPGFGLFDFTALGVIYALVGGAFIILIGYRLLPNYSPLASLAGERSLATYVTELVVGAESKINGKLAPEVFVQIALADRPQPPQPIRRHRRLSQPRSQPEVTLSPDDHAAGSAPQWAKLSGGGAAHLAFCRRRHLDRVGHAQGYSPVPANALGRTSDRHRGRRAHRARPTWRIKWWRQW